MFVKDLTNKPAVWIAASLLGVSGVINLVLWFLVLTKFPQDNVAAVLHYNIATGIDLIGEGTQITVLPIAGLAVLIGNALLGVALVRENASAAWVVWSILPVVQLIVLSAFILIWQAN